MLEITKGWVYHRTHGLRARGHSLDDLHQEAQIAAWKSPDSPYAAAEKRLIGLARGSERYTGSLGAKHFRVPVDKIHELDTARDCPAGRFESQSAIRVDVLRALSKLPPRQKEITFRRFYLRETWQEIADAMGHRTKQGPEVMFRTEAAPRLREELGA